MRILGWAGSLRSASSSAGLLRAAAALAPPDVGFTFYDHQQGQLPHFSPDLDGEGATAPGTVAELRHSIAGSDGILIVCPEYAHGVPGAFKNALDWIVSSGELGGKPTAVLMASPGGAIHARAALLPTLRVMEANIVLDESVRFARTHLGSDGQLLDAEVRAAVERALAALRVGLVEKQ